MSFTMAALRARPGKVLLLAEEKSGSYIAGVEKPAKGWTAYFAELTYPGNGPAPIKFTTEVHVTPDVLPHAPRKTSGMKGFMSGR